MIVDPQKLIDFIRKYLPVAVVVALATTGVAWKVLHSLYDERVSALTIEVKDLGRKVKNLQDEVDVLKQAAERKLEASGATFSAAELQEYSETEPEQEGQ